MQCGLVKPGKSSKRLASHFKLAAHMLSRPVLCVSHTQPSSGAYPQECPYNIWLNMGALAKEEELRALTRDSRRGRIPLCAIRLHRAGKYIIVLG